MIVPFVIGTHISVYCIFNCYIFLTTPAKIIFVSGTVMYMQDAQPRTVIALWKANVEEPKLSLADPYVIIVDTTRSNSAILKTFGFFYFNFGNSFSLDFSS